MFIVQTISNALAEYSLYQLQSARYAGIPIYEKKLDIPLAIVFSGIGLSSLALDAYIYWNDQQLQNTAASVLRSKV